MPGKKFLFVCLVFVAGAIVFSSSVLAAKKRVPRVRSSRCPFRVASVQKSPETGGILISFQNLDKLTKLGYFLSYNHVGTTQGVGGSITLSGQTTDSRNLYLGTCSSGVCTRHWPKTARVTVSAQTSSSSCTSGFLVKTINY